MVLLTTGLVLVAFGTNALANLDCQDTSWPCPEGAFQRYWYNDLLENSPVWLDGVSDTRVQIEGTQMDTAVVQDHSNSDVHFALANFGPTGWDGQTFCQDQSGQICLHWHVQLNTNYPLSDFGKRSVGCEETGHATGLEHRPTYVASNPTCMYGPSNVGIHLDGHDLNHINQIV